MRSGHLVRDPSLLRWSLPFVEAKLPAAGAPRNGVTCKDAATVASFLPVWVSAAGVIKADKSLLRSGNDQEDRPRNRYVRPLSFRDGPGVVWGALVCNICKRRRNPGRLHRRALSTADHKPVE